MPHTPSDKFTGRVLAALPTLSVSVWIGFLPRQRSSRVAGVRSMKSERSTRGMELDSIGEEDLSRDQWIGRFAMRLAMLDDMHHPLELLLQIGGGLWPTYGGVEPEVIADAEYRAGLRR